MKIEEYDNTKIIDFYIQNNIEFNDNQNYFGQSVKSYVIKENDLVIGAISTSIYKNVNYIEAIAITKDKRQKGYGKMLLDFIVNKMDKPIYTISKKDDFYLKNNFVYDNLDLIGKECKICKNYNKTCFPKVMVYK